MVRLRWVLLFASIVCLVAIMGTAYFMEIRKIKRLSRLLDLKMEYLVELSRKNQEMEGKLKFYSTPEGIARLAREQFNMTFPSEKFYKIEIVSADGLSKDSP